MLNRKPALWFYLHFFHVKAKIGESKNWSRVILCYKKHDWVSEKIYTLHNHKYEIFGTCQSLDAGKFWLMKAIATVVTLNLKPVKQLIFIDEKYLRLWSLSWTVVLRPDPHSFSVPRFVELGVFMEMSEFTFYWCAIRNSWYLLASVPPLILPSTNAWTLVTSIRYDLLHICKFKRGEYSICFFILRFCL